MLLQTPLMADPVRRALFERVRDTRMLALSRTMDLAQGGGGVVVYVPIFRGGHFAGVLAGGLRAEPLFAAILQGIAPGYSLVVMAADEELYRRLPAEPAREAEWGQQATIEFVGTRWHVRVWPEASTLAAHESFLPAWALGSGILATLLISIVIALAQEAHRSARLERTANRELGEENAKRQEAEREVKALNSELEQRVKERTTALARANADLRQLAYVSAHDLQEPVRMVATYTQLLALRSQGKLDAEAEQFITYTLEGASRMQMLLTDLLAYLQIDQTEADKSETNCEELLANALRGLQSTITAAAALVTHDPLPTVRSDAAQLTLVFQNLLENALLFRLSTPPRVHIGAERRDEVWVFAVRDNGIGIAPKYAKQIFHMFERLHTQAEYPGTGMGLALCQKIVDRLGGEIWVESQVGQGATFYFTIPLR
jgi:signal transduction histidine kinase